MAEPVTIGGQTFIKTTDGWVDQKSKIRAPEGLLTLLNNLQEENSPEGKKKRVRIDTSRPVVHLGKTEYVWDLNSKVWIDRKTKDAANPAFSKLIEAAYQGITQGVTPDDKLYDKSKAASSVVNSMGSTGQAAKQKVKKPTGGGQFAVTNVKINSPIIRMIEKLATVDGYLKQRLDNQKKMASRNLAAAKENAIEAKPIDATPIEQSPKNDAEKSDATGIGVALLVGGLIAAQFEPVQEAFKTLADGIKGAFNFVGNVAKTISDGLDFFTGKSSTSDPRVETNTTSTPNMTQGGTQSSPNTAEPSLPSAQSETNEASPSVVAEPSSSTPNAQSTMSSAKPAVATSSSSSTNVTSSSKTPNNSVSKASSPSVARPKTTSATPAPSAKPDATPAPAAPQQSSMARDGVTTTTPAPAPKADAKKEDAKKTSATDSVAGYISPVEGHSINSAYGMRKHPKLGGMKFHTGVDIAANAGTPVRAVKSGTVTKISSNQSPYSGFGNVVVIDHGDGYQTVYAHLSKFACKVGDRVQQGQVIGYVGSTGISTGNHLHFIVQKTGHAAPSQGNTVNPAPLLRKGGVTIPAGMEGYDMEGGGGDNALQQVATAGVELTKGAMEAIGTILRAGLGPMTPTSGSQLSTVNDTMSGNIAKAARERTATVAATKTSEPVATTRSDPMNLNASTGSSTIQNMPTASDKAGVDFYLTRMGFPKISYKQNAYAGMRA
jgi:murein DD-endopeptidase MepM/ murein hydrolase activator NlpD